MKKEKKPKHDIVPEIYMAVSNADAFFTHNYPFEAGMYAINDIPNSLGNADEDDGGDNRIENYL